MRRRGQGKKYARSSIEALIAKSLDERLLVAVHENAGVHTTFEVEAGRVGGGRRACSRGQSRIVLVRVEEN